MDLMMPVQHWKPRKNIKKSLSFVSYYVSINYYKQRSEMTIFTNDCPILLEPLTEEDAYLVKVPKEEATKVNSDPKDKYYYISNIDTLKKLECCPFTKREGEYFAVKLANLNAEQKASLLKAEKKDTLIEDNDLLCKIDTSSWKWVKNIFTKQSSYQPVTSHQDLLAINNQINPSILSQIHSSSLQQFGFFGPSLATAIEQIFPQPLHEQEALALHQALSAGMVLPRPQRRDHPFLLSRATGDNSGLGFSLGIEHSSSRFRPFH